MLQPDNTPRNESPYSEEEVVQFLESLDYEEQFEVVFTPEFQEKSHKRGPYIVWYEGCIGPFDPERIQFFYDDGHNNYGPGNDEYPEIFCKYSEIQSLDRSFKDCF